jgi:hypothetical protein
LAKVSPGTCGCCTALLRAIAEAPASEVTGVVGVGDLEGPEDAEVPRLPSVGLVGEYEQRGRCLTGMAQGEAASTSRHTTTQSGAAAMTSTASNAAAVGRPDRCRLSQRSIARFPLPGSSASSMPRTRLLGAVRQRPAELLGIKFRGTGQHPAFRLPMSLGAMRRADTTLLLREGQLGHGSSPRPRRTCGRR